MDLTLAVLSALCFGSALVTARIGLRTIDARSGAAISIPTATVLFLLATPFALDTSNFDVRAALLFAGVGLFFPAVVTLLTFRANELLGPTTTSAISGTAPLFAILAAGLFLGERVPAQAAACAAAIVLGVALLSWNRGAANARVAGWKLLWPVAGAIVRGLAQAGAKAGLLLWPNPFAAGLIGYLISSATVIGTDRLRRPRPRAAAGIAWFAGTGVLNGGAVLLMYGALTMAPVWLVAPIVASYPLITALMSHFIFHDQKLSLPVLSGICVTAGSVIYLVSSPAGP